MKLLENAKTSNVSFTAGSPTNYSHWPIVFESQFLGCGGKPWCCKFTRLFSRDCRCKRCCLGQTV